MMCGNLGRWGGTSLGGRHRERPTAQKTGPLARILRWLALGVTVGALVAWALLLRPGGLGGPGAYVLVRGTSMLPTLRSGELAILHRASDYQVGDIVAYRIPATDLGAGLVVIHRIVGGSASDGFVTKGDNANGPDIWRPTTEDIIGKLWLTVPHALDVLFFLRSPLFAATGASLWAVLLVLGAAGRVDPVGPRPHFLSSPEQRQNHRRDGDMFEPSVGDQATRLGFTAGIRSEDRERATSP